MPKPARRRVVIGRSFIAYRIALMLAYAAFYAW
jgi:hypothetical protein